MPSSPTRPASTPTIIAHRGASRVCRENTLPAFERALEMEVDGIELDIHSTRDGVLVVHHDPTLTMRPGTVDVAVPIAQLTAADVQAHQLPSGDIIPTLSQVFDLVGNRATVYVEVKAPNAEALVASMLSAYPDVRTAVHAFDHRVPVRVRALRPDTPIGLLSASYPLDLRGVFGASGATVLWQHAELIDASLISAAHALGFTVIAWTVNSAPHARELAAWGVDGICSDVPDAIRTALLAERQEG